MDSILNDIKKLVGLTDEYKVFDKDIITYINTVFLALAQMGVGPETPFSIEDESDTWDDFAELSSMESVKTYIAKRVTLMFDPPTSSALEQAIKDQIEELEFRLMIAEDTTT